MRRSKGNKLMVSLLLHQSYKKKRVKIDLNQEKASFLVKKAVGFGA